MKKSEYEVLKGNEKDNVGGARTESPPVHKPSDRGQEQPSDAGDSAGTVHAEANPEELLREAEALWEQERLRLMADFQNYRRRNEAEKGELALYAEAELIKKLLPVMDNFDRALQSLPDTGAAGAWSQGVELVYRNLLTVLEQEGLEQVSTDQAFDPNCHEAVMREVSGEVAEGTILQEFTPGYWYQGRLLRASKVKVAVSK